MLLPARIYHPRALVLLDIQLDDVAGTPIVLAVTPRSVEWRRNSARKCDEAVIELDAKDLPLDPRLLAAVHVAIHVEDALDPSFPLVPSRLNLRFVGSVDEPESTLGPDRETVRLECRDYTAIYMGQSWTACCPVPAGAPAVLATPPGTPLIVLVEGIRQLLTPLTLPTVPLAPEATKAIPFNASGRAVYAPRDKGETAWDVLCGLCDLHGLVPSWDLDLLTVRSASQNGALTAFMVYGENITSLKFRRNLQHPKEDKAIKVTAWNPATGSSLSASWPTVQPPAAPSTQTGSSTVRVVEYHVEGPYTPADLLALAQRLYTESSRQKLQGELETMDLTDVAGVPLLGLKNGDRLTCHLSPDSASSIAGMSPDEAVRFLSDPMRTNAMLPAVAAALVNAWTATQQLATTFYVNEAVHKWDRDQGYKLTIRFSEFVLGV